MSELKSFLRLEETENGDIVLVDSANSSEPMLKLRFSDEARNMMQGYHLEIASSMVKAGVIAFQNLSENIIREVFEEQANKIVASPRKSPANKETNTERGNDKEEPGNRKDDIIIDDDGFFHSATVH